MYYEVLLNFILNYSWIKNREKLNASTRYFTKEVYFYSIYKCLNRHKEKETLTIGDLEKGILAGCLNDYILSKEKAK